LEMDEIEIPGERREGNITKNYMINEQTEC
jgi:hypothetical protein